MMKYYDVLIRPANPAFDDQGHVYDIEATSKKKALKEARKIRRRECLYDRLDGKILYTITETN